MLTPDAKTTVSNAPQPDATSLTAVSTAGQSRTSRALQPVRTVFFNSTATISAAFASERG